MILLSLESFSLKVFVDYFIWLFLKLCTEKMLEEFFGSYFSGHPFYSNGTKTDLYAALLKAMIASGDRKE